MRLPARDPGIKAERRRFGGRLVICAIVSLSGPTAFAGETASACRVPEAPAGSNGLAPPEPAAQQARLADFEFVTAKVAENYAGYEAKTAGSKRAELDALTIRLRAQVDCGNEVEFRRALEQWIGWFEDGHLRLQWANADAAPAWQVPPRSLSEAAARARLRTLGPSRRPIEGLWTIDDRYRLAVLRRDDAGDVHDAVVLSTTAERWQPGDVKAVLTAQPDGGFAVRYGTGDRTELTFAARLASRNDVLDVGELGIWRLVQDDPAEAAAALRRWPDDSFTLTRLDTETLYLRLPSFNDTYTDTVRALVAAHREEIARTPNLIIDVRGNGGGSDFVYDPVLPFLYTRPIWRIGVDVRVSADNARLRRAIADQLAAVSPEAAKTLRDESERMATAATPFIRREPPIEVVRLDGPLAYPARIAVLIDRAGSSAENFIMDARQSRKVVLMGQENSAGVIDHGEMMSMDAPSRRFTLAWATTRSLRLPNDPVDPDGIRPDVLIPSDIADPVMWAAQRIQSNVRDR